MPRLRLLLLSAALAVAAVPAVAESTPAGPVWSSETYDYGAVLNLGIADSPEDVTLSLYCDNDEHYLELGVFEEIPESEPGEPLTLTIASATKQATITGETTTDEMSGFVYAGATGFPLGPLLAVLKSPGPATVSMASATVDLPAEGRTEAASAFAVGCRVP